jgi:hypothetical protein
MVGCCDCRSRLVRCLASNGAGGEGRCLDQSLGPASARPMDQSLGPAWPMDQSLGASPRWMGELVVRDASTTKPLRKMEYRAGISACGPIGVNQV